ncbi:MAG: DUF547 domain-containing protein [Pseudomonadota bacterium]|nr:DUF547 domain-containing protein [Pseudomonadota bacterium]
MNPLHRLLLMGVLLLAALPARAAFDQDHAAWNALLAPHVSWNAAGTTTQVDYAGFARDRARLDAYVKTLGAVPRADYERWSWPQRQAFLINAYNAATVQLVLTRYPKLDSIKEIGGLLSSPWKRRFVPLLGQTRSLDDIEHGLLRGAPEYRDPRIHFAVNCASLGCPALRPEAFTAAQLDAQLRDQTRRFVRDRSRNRVRAAMTGGRVTLELSSIFDWYGGDFARAGGVAGFVAGYADAIGASPAQAAALRAGKVELRFLDYDWSLNDRAGRAR